MDETLVYLIWHERWRVAKIGICGIDTGRIKAHHAHGFKTAATIQFSARAHAANLETAVKAAWRRCGWEPASNDSADYRAWTAQVGGATETVSLNQCGSVVELWKMVEGIAEQLGKWVGMNRANAGSAPAPATCCPRQDFQIARDLGREDLIYERRIVWLEAPENHDYVRQSLNTSFHRTGQSDLLLRNNGYSRCIGYAELERGAPHFAGAMFRRRLFYVSKWDRCCDPDGAYRTRCPVEAVDPMTVEAGISGRLTARAWGAVIPPPVRSGMPCPYRHEFTDDPLDRPCRGADDDEWLQRWRGTW